MEQYLSIKDVADWLSVDYKTIYRLIRQQELPAAKIGGVYRIRKEDVEAYVGQQLQSSAPEAVTVTAPQFGAPQFGAPQTGSLQKCGVCRRLLRDESDIGGICLEPTCETPICTTCWKTNEQHYCALHQPARAELLREAQERARQKAPGERLLSAPEARQREQSYIVRFDTKVRRITKLWHPVRQQVISPPRPWEQLHRSTDEVESLMGLLQTGFLDQSLEREMPFNIASRYTLPGSGAQQPGLILEAQVLSPLAALVKQGFATEPLGPEALTPVLERCIQIAEAQSTAYLIGIAATSGWSKEALAAIAAGEAGRTFYHPLVLPCLVDLESFALTYNAQDARIAPLAPLFAPRLPEEELERAIEVIERELRGSHGVSVADVLAEEPGMDPGLIRRAFARLVEQGTHRQEVFPDIGEVIVKAGAG